GQLGDLLRGADSAVFAWIQAEDIRGLVADYFQGILRRQYAFIRHDRNTTAAPHCRHRPMISPVCRLLKECHFQLLQPPSRPKRLLHGVAAVGVDGQPNVWSNGVPNGTQSIDVDPWM